MTKATSLSSTAWESSKFSSVLICGVQTQKSVLMFFLENNHGRLLPFYLRRRQAQGWNNLLNPMRLIDVRDLAREISWFTVCIGVNIPKQCGVVVYPSVCGIVERSG